MRTDARAALERLVAALDAHLTAAEQRRGEQDPHVERAYRILADAFETYDEALYDAFDEVTPLVLYDDVEDQRDDDDDEPDDSDDVDDEIEDVDEEDLTEDDSDDLPELEEDEEDEDEDADPVRGTDQPRVPSTQETSSRA